MRSRWLIPVAMAALFAFSVPALAAPTLAWAEDPVTFGARHIADKVGAVTARSAAVNAALDKLYADTRTDLFVVYVDAFTGVADRQQWADKTADDNGLGTNDVLLAIATGDREYQLSVAPDFALTDAQLREVETVAIEPALRVNDWAGAAIGAANGLAAGITGGTITAPEITPGDAAPGRSAGGSIGIILMILIVIALLVVGAVVLFIVCGRRRPALPPAGTPPTGLQAPPTIELKRRAASALVQTDDAVKSSEQELGFAIAQYGSAATDAFQSALTTAKAQLTEAFTLQQRLDDSEPDSEEQQRTWYAGIVDLCGRANTALDEQIDDFDALRQLEKKAPAAVASATLEVATIEARVTSADAALAALAARYTDNAIATVADNPRQARERIAFAGAALAEATTRLSAGETDPRRRWGPRRRRGRGLRHSRRIRRGSHPFAARRRRQVLGSPRHPSPAFFPGNRYILLHTPTEWVYPVCPSKGHCHDKTVHLRPHRPACEGQHQCTPGFRRGSEAHARPDGARLHQQHRRRRGRHRRDHRQPAPARG